MPTWWGHINKRLFNPRAIREGERPVITHVGRSSGNVYQTPLDAYPVTGGYVFALVYSSRADWVQNVLAAGSASLRLDGEEFALIAPRLITKEAALLVLPPTAKLPPRVLRIGEYLQMDIAT